MFVASTNVGRKIMQAIKIMSESEMEKRKTNTMRQFR